MTASALETAAPARPRSTDESFESLFVAEYRRVVRIAARVLGERARAEDVAQDVFIAFARRYPAGASFAAPWLHAAAAHAALNVLRGDRRRRDRERREARLRDALDHAGALALDPASLVERTHDRERVRVAMAGLGGRRAAILALRYAGLSYAEVAQALGVRPGSVGTMLARAEAALAAALEA